VSSSPKRVEALTGARALAGLYILLLHFGAPLFTHAPAWARTLRENGYVATSFFLMLSGFVLTVAYGNKLAQGRIDRRGFWVQRIARLYPSYALALLLLLPFAIVHRWGEVTASFGDASLRAKVVTGLAHASMSHVLVPRLTTSWNVPGWCVSVEMWFYLGFPFAVPWLLARRTRTVVAVLAGAGGAALASCLAYTLLQPDGFRASLESVGFWIALYKFTPWARWPEFLFGIALGALWLRVPAERRGQRWATPLVLVGASSMLLILLHGDRIPYTMLHNGSLLPLYALTLWGLMLGRGPLNRALSLRPLTTLGDACYVLYVLQVPVMQWLMLVGGRHYGADVDAPFTAVALVVTVATAITVHLVLEQHAQAWLKARLFRLWTPRPSTTPLVPSPVAPTPIASSAGA
jgi:peptidoglycan/LPS O-acetylase OafA/YrhL